MDFDDYRWSALARYHDAALESAMLMLALTRLPERSHDDTAFWRVTHVRALVRLYSKATIFSINARKSIEIASVIDSTIIAHARSMRVHPLPAKAGEQDLCQKDFWWILSRIVHSISLGVVWDTSDHQVIGTQIHSVSRMRAIGFGSDFDGPTAVPGGFTVDTEHMHYVGVEEFISIYSGSIAEMIDNAIKTLRPSVSR